MRRHRTGRVIGGVASGLADHLSVKVLWVRAAFALLAAASAGAALVAYAMFWVFVPQETITAAEHRSSPKERQQAFGLIALGISLVVARGTLSGTVSTMVAVPVGVALCGAAVVWQEADAAQRRRWVRGARSGVSGAVLGGGGRSALVRVTTGVLLVLVGIGVVLLRSTTFGQLQIALGAVLATLVGVAVLTVPWWLRLVQDLGQERRARIRTEERAEIAAHLHDSVLQTLALIQKQPDVSREVLRLARGQERQLRGWLYGPDGYGDTRDTPRGPAGHGRRQQDGQGPGGARAGHPRGHHQRGQAFRRRGDQRVRRGRTGERDGVRARPGQGIRPGGRVTGPARARRLDPGEDGAARWFGGPAEHDRRGHRGAVDDAADGSGREERKLMADNKPVRVYLVDDHALFRAGVRAELDNLTDDVEVVGEAGSVAEAVVGIAHTTPDVVLLDVHMPDGGGAEVLRRIRPELPDVVFLALSVSDAAEDVIAVIRAGARGYVTKTISSRELVTAIARVAVGDAVFSPRLAGFVLDAFADRPGAAPISDPDLDLLTPRERDVLRLLARGYAYKEIASELFISVKTVETHVSSVLRKTQLSNRYELSRWATDRRLV